MSILINSYTTDKGIVITVSDGGDIDRAVLSWDEIAEGLRQHSQRAEVTPAAQREG